MVSGKPNNFEDLNWDAIEQRPIFQRPEPDWTALTLRNPSTCNLRVNGPDGAPIFICLDAPGHGGTLHHNLTATWDDAAKELRRGTHSIPNPTPRTPEMTDYRGIYWGARSVPEEGDDQ